jgi:hypothetical protein
MFGRRPRYDDTFGVRMDLGADRKDPMSLRPTSQAGRLRVKAPVLVEQPVSIFGRFGKRETDPFSVIRDKPATAPPAPEKFAAVTKHTQPQLPHAAPGVQADRTGCDCRLAADRDRTLDSGPCHRRGLFQPAPSRGLSSGDQPAMYCAPLTVIVAPLMKAASSEAR